MTKRFRENKEKILNPEFNVNILPLSETFNKEAFSVFMKNPACVGIRIYYGMSENLDVHAILVGVDAENRDILPGTLETVTEAGDIVEEGQRCPPECEDDSPLNTP